MTNLVAAIIITTNSHWTLLETKPSNYGCLVLGCRRDHSEMRWERKDSYRVTQAQFEFEGRTTNITLKCESIGTGTETRLQYSGVDYERTYQQVRDWRDWTNSIPR